MQMMLATAKRYDRSQELDMENMELGEVIEKLDEDLPDWKTESYINHLFNTDSAAILCEEKYVKILSNNLTFLKPHIPSILDYYFHTCQAEQLKALIFKIFVSMKYEEVVNMFQTYHSMYGIQNKMKSTNWDERFIVALNKFSLGSEDEETNKELLLLAIEDGKLFLKNVISRAIESSGKVKTCSKLLLFVFPLCKSYEKSGIADSDFILVDMIMNVVFETTAEKENERQNLFSLILSIGQSQECQPNVCSQTSVRLLQQIFTEFNGTIREDILSKTTFLQTMLKDVKLFSQFDSSLIRKIGVSFSFVINYISTVDIPDDLILQMKTVLLDIIPLVLTSSQMKQLLNSDNLSYFSETIQTNSVKEIIRKNYFKADNDALARIEHDKETISAELLNSLPSLTEKEWRILCKSGKMSSEIIPIIIELLIIDKLDKQTVYQIVRSLCAELPVSWQNLTQLVTLFNFITSEELVQLVWSAVMNNMAKLLEAEKDEVDSKMRNILEMFLCLPENHKNNILLAMDLMKKFKSREA